MAKFKVVFKGFAFIDAEDAEEVEEKFDDEDYAYCEHWIETVEEIDEFVIRVRNTNGSE